MNDDDHGSDLESNYERRTIDAISRTRAAIVGTARGVYRSLPLWLQRIWDGAVVMFIIWLIYLVLTDGFGLSMK